MAETLTVRPPAVQAGVDAFLAKYTEELRRIHALDADKQEQDFSAVMAGEVARVAKMGVQDPGKELATQILIALETDRILALDSKRQQKVIAEKYNLDPKALIDHYPELQTKSVELRKKLDVAESKTAFMGWGALLATVAATLIPFGERVMDAAGKLRKRDLGDRFSGGNKLIKWFFVPLISLAAGFAGSYIGSGFFARKVKEESKVLATDSRIALEREVVDAVESKVRSDIAYAAETSAAPALAASIERKTPPQPRENFVAEVAKEKATAQAANAGIG